jgi:prepilin-type N-terminal cleavage/methylation domain-containing protein
MHRSFIDGQKTRYTRQQRGLTLVELLTVIAVMAILLSVAVPVIRPSLKDRKLRESARLINAYVAGVQARATELGRPVGIVLSRGTTNARGVYQCTEIFTAEVPRPYAGDLVDSKAVVSQAGNVWTVSFPNNPFFNTLLSPKELFALKLDYKEPLYHCRRSGDQQALIDNSSLDLSGPPRQLVNADGSAKRSVPFQIMRSPTRSTAAPLQLPNGIGLDLSVSGMGFRGTEFNPTSKLGAGNITIMFNPNGSIERVYVGGQPLPQTTRIYLMIGRINQINPTNPFQQGNNSNETANLRDPANYWMSINPKTGLIRSSINRADLIKNSDVAGIKLQQSRADAIEGITVGGR